MSYFDQLSIPITSEDEFTQKDFLFRLLVINYLSEVQGITDTEDLQEIIPDQLNAVNIKDSGFDFVNTTIPIKPRTDRSTELGRLPDKYINKLPDTLRYHRLNYRENLQNLYPNWSDFFTSTPSEIGLGENENTNYVDVFEPYFQSKVVLPSGLIQSVRYKDGKYKVHFSEDSSLVSPLGSFSLLKDNPGDGVNYVDIVDNSFVMSANVGYISFSFIKDKITNEYLDTSLYRQLVVYITGSNQLRLTYYGDIIKLSDKFVFKGHSETSNRPSSVYTLDGLEIAYRDDIERFNRKSFLDTHSVGAETAFGYSTYTYDVERIMSIQTKTGDVDLSTRYVYCKKYYSYNNGNVSDIYESNYYEFDHEPNQEEHDKIYIRRVTKEWEYGDITLFTHPDVYISYTGGYTANNKVGQIAYIVGTATRQRVMSPQYSVSDISTLSAKTKIANATFTGVGNNINWTSLV